MTSILANWEVNDDKRSTTWVSEDPTNANDVPVELSDDDIKYILEYLPYTPAADSDSSQLAHKGVMNWLVSNLKDVKCCPSAIQDVIQDIVKAHESSLVVPGTAIGTLSGEALGAPTTQMALNSVAPHEQLLLCDENNNFQTVKIGPWIDKIIEDNNDKIVHIPENRTQYVELSSPYYITTCNSKGVLSWEKITAVTKHLPVGDLVKITTKSNRNVTVTQSKSLLIWNGKEIISCNGKDAKIGDRIPISLDHYGRIIREKGGVILDRKAGINMANFWLGKTKTPIISNWLNTGCLPWDFIYTPEEFLQGFLDIANKSLPAMFLTPIGQNWIDSIRRQSGQYRNDENMIFGDVMLDEIVSIEYISGIEYVYDLTEPVTKNFSLLNGIVCEDTFHQSGSAASASSGIERMRDLIFAKENPRHESCTIYFKDKTLSYEDVLFLRKDIVGTNFTDFVNDYDISAPNRLKRDVKLPGTPENLQPFWWQDGSLLGMPVPPNVSRVLRLYLNKREMFKYNMTMQQLADVLKREIPQTVIAVYGPFEDGILDLYPDSNMLKTTVDQIMREMNTAIPSELVSAYYLENIVYPQLKKTRVKGIPHITKSFPVVYDVWKTVNTEEAIKGTFPPRWTITLNPIEMKDRGLNGENVARLCSEAAIRILAVTNDTVTVELPLDSLISEKRKPLTAINNTWFQKLPKESWISLSPNQYAKVIPNQYAKVIPNSVIINNGVFENRSTDIEIFIADVNIRSIRGSFYYRLGEIVIIGTKQYETLTLATLTNEIYFREVTNDLIIIEGEKYYPVKIGDLKRISKGFNMKVTGDFLVQLDSRGYVLVEGKAYQSIDATLEGDDLYEIYNGKVFSLKPSGLINSRLTLDKADLKARWAAEINRRAANRDTPFIRIERSNLIKASELIYVRTEGENLREILALPFVDKNRTICDNMHTVASTLGIEAARKFIIKALDETIKAASSYAHPFHLQLIAEFITNRGRPYGANYTGISRQPGGHMSLATVERAGKVLSTNALHGGSEDVRNVSASIAMGARMRIGTGFFEVAENVDINGIETKILNEQLFEEKRFLYRRPTRRVSNDCAAAMKRRVNIPKTATGFDFTGEDEKNTGIEQEDFLTAMDRKYKNPAYAVNVVFDPSDIPVPIDQFIQTSSSIGISPDPVPLEYRSMGDALLVPPSVTVNPSNIVETFPDLQSLMNRYLQSVSRSFNYPSSTETLSIQSSPIIQQVIQPSPIIQQVIQPSPIVQQEIPPSPVVQQVIPPSLALQPAPVTFTPSINAAQVIGYLAE